MAISEALAHKLELLPDSAGCYIMKNDKNEILYVGKAKVLKNRVRSYFHGVHNNKTTKLVSQIADFEFIQTSTEKEALLLEINLIKKHRPPFNIMFMDDKMYPYIEVTPGADFAVRLTRRVVSKKNDYFGPYPVAAYAYDMVKLLNRLFPIRKCRTMPKTPCLYYHMGQCEGFCFQDVDEQKALENRNKVIRFLKGNTGEILDELKARMEKAAEELQFEKAQEILEEIKSIEYVAEKQTIDFKKNESFDVFGWYEESGYLSIQGFFVREGKLLERNMSIAPIFEDTQDAFTAYILQYYQTNVIPKQIFVPEGTPVGILEEALNTQVHTAQRGEKKKLTDLVVKNAREAHEQKFKLVLKKDQELDSAMEQLSEIFGKKISTVELFDNSHIQGAYNVSGLVVFKDGKPDKSQYRKYQLSEYKGDTQSMKEVVRRRYSRLAKENKPLPDLLLVDGGVQQMNAAKEVLDELGIHVTLAGLVKDDKHSTRALLDESHQEVPLDRQSPLFFLLTRMQDEVHRFAVSYHKKLRAKGMTKSILEDIPGIGPARRKTLKTRYPSMKKMKEASLEDFEALVPAQSARILYDRLHEQQES
ncbi:MAG: excinuclease ABC subunit UvrC [Erysipelotrichaceae bacterium]|nr:excinuclease ABC subunit UvrC [Erysipelotrichaceae bacterium]